MAALEFQQGMGGREHPHPPGGSILLVGWSEPGGRPWDWMRTTGDARENLSLTFKGGGWRIGSPLAIPETKTFWIRL